MPVQPRLAASPLPSPPTLPPLWSQLPPDQQRVLAQQLAVLLRRRWTHQATRTGGQPHDHA
ncbi:MAG: hypothetical protein ACYDCQ_16235 [Dehalococcoidia bacterium]